MTREEAKELMPIIQAFAEGKTIQYYDSLIDIADWEDCENPNFENLTYKFRIKPEPIYRPFKDTEECWNEMQKHQPFGWVKSKENGYYSFITMLNNRFRLNGYDGLRFDDTIKKFTFADGTPFGVKEDK